MTTHRYRLTVELTSPAAPAAGRERGFVTPAYDYVPGSVVRGALAARWIAVHGRPEDDPDAFDAHVVGLRVGPALPVDARRVPLSVYQCKYPTTATCRSTAVDAAFDQVTSCPGCGAPLEPSRGQWTASPRVVRRSSTALDADETAAEQQLFARDELAARQTFSARASGDLRWLGEDPTPLRVGGRRSVLGGAVLTVEQSPPQPTPAPSSTVVVVLDSPAVFVDECGRTRLVPQRGDLERSLRGTDGEQLAAGVTVDSAWFRPDSAGGWNAAGGLPKATEAATAAGSVFRLKFPEPLSSAAQAAIADRGLGARRTDGLGWVEIVPEPWRRDEPTGHRPTAPRRPPKANAWPTTFAGDTAASFQRPSPGAARGTEVTHQEWPSAACWTTPRRRCAEPWRWRDPSGCAFRSLPSRPRGSTLKPTPRRPNGEACCAHSRPGEPASRGARQRRRV